MSQIADESAYVLWLNQIMTQFTYFINLIICPTGVALNMVSILVFSRKSFKANTMGFYYTSIALIDISVLVAGFINYYSVTTNQDVSLISTFSCVLMTYSNRITLQMSSWANVLITFDRLICVTYRNKFAFMKKKRNLFFGFIIFFVLI